MSSMRMPGPAGSGPKPPLSSTVIFLTGLVGLFGWYAYRTGRLNQDNFIYFAILIPSVILHEISHGLMANIFGDDTAKRAGRLTLNPLRHIDPLGTIIIPAVLIYTTGTAFGYAKPVPVNTTHMSRNKAMMVGLIGPITNIVIALLAALALQIFATPENFRSEFIIVLFELGIANVTLATFNLIPIPPLDGASIVERFLPQQYMAGYYKFRQYSMFLLILITLNSQTSLNRVFTPAIHLWERLLP